MKNIFRRSNFPFLTAAADNHKDGRAQWNLARLMQDQNGFTHHIGTEILLLQRGAYAGDLWSMCELARTYFNHCPDTFLPQALMWWNKAILSNDPGARSDAETLPIRERILTCHVEDDAYANLEIQCAMLSQWHLTQLGLVDWASLRTAEREERIRNLMDDLEPLLMLPRIRCQFIPDLRFDGDVVDGVAHPDEEVHLRTEMIENCHRLIQVLFFLLGCAVTCQIQKHSINAAQIQRLFGLSDERIQTWDTGTIGFDLPTATEDQNTLSYGVYSHWALLFADSAQVSCDPPRTQNSSQESSKRNCKMKDE